MRFRNAIGVLSLAAVAAGFAAPASAQEEQETTTEPTVDVVIATGVENGQPVGQAEQFPADVGELVAFLDIEGAAGETLAVVWSYQGSESEESIVVEGETAHQWTALQVPEQATGEWSVEIRHGESILTSKTFTIGVQ